MWGEGSGGGGEFMEKVVDLSWWRQYSANDGG